MECEIQTPDANIEASESNSRLEIAEMQVDRAKLIMQSLAGFCHALGQPATVILSSIELLQMDGVDDETKKQVIDMCHEAVLEIKSLLAEMKKQREYVADAFRIGESESGETISIAEWREKLPPKASWDK